MKKLVQENLIENWVSTDTGMQRYSDNPYTTQQTELIPKDAEEIIKQIVPPPTEKLSPEAFSNYINYLMTAIVPKSPMLALTVFKEVMKLHPYLSKKPIGFGNKINPYEPYIEKFMQLFKNLAKQ